MAEAPPLTPTGIFNFIWAHWYVIGLHITVVAQFVGSWMIGALDMPTDKDSKSYRFWFRTFNYLAGNKSRAAAAAVPGPEDTVRKETVTTTEKTTTQVIIPEATVEKILEKKDG